MVDWHTDERVGWLLLHGKGGYGQSSDECDNAAIGSSSRQVHTPLAHLQIYKSVHEETVALVSALELGPRWLEAVGEAALHGSQCQDPLLYMSDIATHTQ
jgi:hypothetical protein